MKASEYEYDSKHTVYMKMAGRARRKAGKARLAEADAQAAESPLAEVNFKKEAEIYELLARMYHDAALSHVNRRAD